MKTMMCSKEKEENLYKKDLKSLIEYKRGENGDRVVDIVKGIIPISNFYKLDRGQHIDDKIVVDRILKRVGIDPSEVEMIILQKDAKRFIQREKIYELYNNKQYDEMETLMKQYEQGVSHQHKIHYQFLGKIGVLLMMQKGTNINLTISILKQVIAYTVPDFEKKPLKELCLAPEEMELLIMLATCYRRKNQLTRAKNLLRQIVNYPRTRKISGKLIAMYEPYACLELSKIYEAKEQYEDARYYAATGIKILYCNAELPYLVALQDQYIKLEEKANARRKLSSARRRKLARMKEERSVIVELYEESELDPYQLYSVEKYKNCYVFDELLERYRKFWNMSKKEFCGGICTSQAFLQIEAEGICPVKTFSKWMKRVGLPQTYYITQLHGGSLEHIRKKVRINHYIKRNQYEKAEILFDQLEEEFEESQLIARCPENRQYFARVRTILKRTLHGLAVDEAKKELENALRYTIPEYSEGALGKRPLLKQEVKILNSLAIGNAKKLEYQNALSIWKEIIKGYQNNALYGYAIYDEYNAILINYSTIVGSEGRYAESTEQIYKNIANFFKEGILEWGVRCCYDIAWNREQEILKQKGRIEPEEFIQGKLRQAEVIARMLNNSFYIGFLKGHKERFS